MPHQSKHTHTLARTTSPFHRDDWLASAIWNSRPVEVGCIHFPCLFTWKCVLTRTRITFRSPIVFKWMSALFRSPTTKIGVRARTNVQCLRHDANYFVWYCHHWGRVNRCLGQCQSTIGVFTSFTSRGHILTETTVLINTRLVQPNILSQAWSLLKLLETWSPNALPKDWIVFRCLALKKFIKYLFDSIVVWRPCTSFENMLEHLPMVLVRIQDTLRRWIVVEWIQCWHIPFAQEIGFRCTECCCCLLVVSQCQSTGSCLVWSMGTIGSLRAMTCVKAAAVAV